MYGFVEVDCLKAKSGKLWMRMARRAVAFSILEWRSKYKLMYLSPCATVYPCKFWLTLTFMSDPLVIVEAVIAPYPVTLLDNIKILGFRCELL
jgi:hypothetical protein